MLVIADSGKGQMANQLFFMAHVLASAYERGFYIKFYDFRRYEGIIFSEKSIDKCFDVDEKKIKRRALICMANLMKIVKKTKCLRLVSVRSSDDAKDVVATFLKTGAFSQKDYYWVGWPFTDYFSLRKNKLIIRNFFDFSERIKRKAEKIIFQRNDIICGVHIRKGDYKIWNGGKYYFEDNVYIRIASEIKNYINKKVCFILCSNEKIDLDKWNLKGLEAIVSKGDAILDLCLLSKCDLIIGPPSTFSTWASFMGKVRRFVIDVPDKKFDYNDCYIGLEETDGLGNLNRIYEDHENED